jgi:hypothetical protein
MKRKARKRLKKTITKAMAKYGAPAVLAFVSTLAANLVSDSVDRDASTETGPDEKKTAKARPKKRKTSRA